MKKTLKFTLEISIDVSGDIKDDQELTDIVIDSMNDSFPSVIFDNSDTLIFTDSFEYKVKSYKDEK